MMIVSFRHLWVVDVAVFIIIIMKIESTVVVN